MIEGLITKDDLRNQTSKYDKEMEKIQKKIYKEMLDNIDIVCMREARRHHNAF